jgi:TolB protein
MFGKRKVICHFDGLNMQPTFSSDGKKVIFCLSKDGSSQLYLSYIDERTHQRKFDRLTFNNGQNIAPCFIDQNNVAFVSDFQTNKPQIYVLNLQSKVVKKITDGGYCACPNYSAVRNQLVYSKMLGGGMQLFTYDFKTQAHTQITKTAGSKEEGSWSACGNYVVFCYNKGNVSRIAQLHLPTNSIKFLTSESDACSYPDCSPIYQDCIGILNR